MSSSLLPLDHLEDEEGDEDNEFEPLTPRFSVPSASSSEPPQPYSFDDMGHASTYLQFFKSSSNRNQFPFDAYAVDNTTRTPLQPVHSASKPAYIRSSIHRDSSPSSQSTSTNSYSDEKVDRLTISKRPFSSYEMSSSSTVSEKENIGSIPSASYSLQSTPTDASSYKGDADRSGNSTLWGESFISVVSRKPNDDELNSLHTSVSRSTNPSPHLLYPSARQEQKEYIYENGRESDIRSASQGGRGESAMTRYGLGSLRHPWTQFLFQRILRMPEHYYRRSEVQYLQEQHEWKCQQMRFGIRKKDAEEDRRFDFVLILQPQEVYGFWAQRLDFREELLGPHILAGMEEQWQELLSHNSEDAETEDADSIIPVIGGGDYSGSSTGYSSDPEQPSSSESTDEEEDIFIDQPTPPYSSTLRRRVQRTPALEHTHQQSPQHLYRTPPSAISKQPNRSHLRSDASPGLYSYLDKSYSSAWTNRTNATLSKPLSLFERALGSPPTITPSSSLLPECTPASNNNPAYTYPRKWGNPVSGATTQPRRPLGTQPPMSASATTPVQRALPTKPSTVDPTKETENTDPNCIRIEDIPNSSIARGIAARTNRTHGRLPFWNALRDGGIVVRRHRPGREAVFCRISSPDGGDTLLLQTIPRDEALAAFAQQRELHPPPANNKSAPQYWSLPDTATGANHPLELLPSYRNLLQPLTQLVPYAWKGTRSVHMSQVATIHPASNADPRWANEFGTVTLRRSQSSHVAAWSFSLVLQKYPNGAAMEDVKVQWHRGEGNDAQFRYVDLEAATESDYWFLLRGLLFLHRDALVGRYAKDRAAGMGTRRLDAVGCEKIRDSVLHVDEFHEPLTVGWLERTIVNVRKLDTTYREGYVTKLDAVPPPSDYFLGFRSPGTAIWSRLRQAGLETQRVYSLDPNRVMIKVRCPPDRLMDVAEVLRIKLKTKAGSFAPFREDMMDDFAPMVDPLEDPPPHPPSDVHYDFYQFRSSIRQTIIDFIIGSRIRDSGAELGPRDLGQKIQARVPLHVPAKLDAIYASWFYFWKEENWKHGRQTLSLTHVSGAESLSSSVKLDIEQGNAEPSSQKKRDDDDEGDRHAQMPNLITRILVGSMFQPLDSIEEYFGEKVAFYFTWLEHTAKHLVYLSAAGLILLFFQLGSGKIDHPLRPIFSIVVMIWTFIVLINWKKRANYMAYRWGTMNFKEQETTRPQFIGETTKDEITGELIITYPKWKRWLKYCISFPLTLLFTMGTLILILWVHANRDWQLATYFSDNASPSDPPEMHGLPLSAIGRRGPVVNVELSRENLQSPKFWFIVFLLPSMLGLFLPLLNFLLMRLSIILNDFENYRTESEYRTYLIIKVFSFRFVCYFATLYYYSILSIGEDASTESGQQAIENGILRVGMGVLVYTTVAQWWQNFVHICFPMLIGQLRMSHRNQRLADELHDIEIEEEEIYRLSTIRFDQTLKERQVRLVNKRLLLEQAQDDVWIELLLPMHDSFPEYIQAVVQFTFVSCFSVVLPITPLIVLFNYLISMRLDAYKLCRGRRRPISEKTGGIGVWEHVLHIVAVISVLTNCWLMGFLSSQFYWIKEEITEIGLFAVVVIWEHIMLLIKYIMSNSISPLPKTVRDAMKREQYILDQQRTTLMQERRQLQQQQLNEELSSVLEDPPSQHRLSRRHRHRNKHSRDATSIAESPSLMSSPSFDNEHRHSASTSSVRLCEA